MRLGGLSRGTWAAERPPRSRLTETAMPPGGGRFVSQYSGSCALLVIQGN